MVSNFSHFSPQNRQQSLLSDEQAKEVEQILNAAPTVGVAVAAVVATATSPTSIKNLIEETHPAAGGEQDIQIAAVPAIVDEEDDDEELEEDDHARAEFNEDADGDSDDVEAVDIVGYGQATATGPLNATFTKADSTETETTTTTTPSTATTATTRHDDDEPEWLRDVLEVRLGASVENTTFSFNFLRFQAPKRSLENLLITSGPSAGGDGQREEHFSEAKHSDLNQTYVTGGGESLHESIVSVESTQSDATLNQTTTIDDSIISSKHNSTYSLADVEQATNSTVLSTGVTELDDSQYYIPEYPPVRSKEVLVEAGVHYFEDGNFWMEVPGRKNIYSPVIET